MNTGEEFQVKFYADEAKSTKAQSVNYRETAKNLSTKAPAEHSIAQGDVDPSSPIYKGIGRVIPKDQTADAELFLGRKAAKESATRKANVNAIQRPKTNCLRSLRIRGALSRNHSLSRIQDKLQGPPKKETSI